MPTLYGRTFRTFLTVVCVTLFITAGACAFAAAPEVPSAPRPGDGATDQAITVSFAWIGGGAVTYDFYFGTEEDPPLVASNLPAPNYQGAVLEFETVYRWRVVARDQFGVETSGPVWSFLTRFNSPPIIPFGPDPPQNGAAPPNVTLHWRSGDPDQQPVTYRLFFGATNPPPLLATDLTERSYALNNLHSNTTYYWHVLAFDGRFTVGGPLWRFHVILLPVLIAKFDAAQAGDGVEVTWELSSDEAITQATLYRRTTRESLPVPIATVDPFARWYRDDTVEAGRTYHYELAVQTVDEELYRSPVATVTMRPHALTLMQNHPNPFNPSTTIDYSVNERARVVIGIYDAAGTLIARLDDGEHDPGNYHVEWNGRDSAGHAVGSGVYFYRLEGAPAATSRKMVLLK